METLEQKQAEMQPEVARLKQKIETQKGKIEKIQTRVHDVEDRIFAPLSKEVRLPYLQPHPRSSHCPGSTYRIAKALH